MSVASAEGFTTRARWPKPSTQHRSAGSTASLSMVMSAAASMARRMFHWRTVFVFRFSVVPTSRAVRQSLHDFPRWGQVLTRQDWAVREHRARRPVQRYYYTDAEGTAGRGSLSQMPDPCATSPGGTRLSAALDLDLDGGLTRLGYEQFRPG